MNRKYKQGINAPYAMVNDRAIIVGASNACRPLSCVTTDIVLPITQHILSISLELTHVKVQERLAEVVDKLAPSALDSGIHEAQSIAPKGA
jgi:hypothetical protein